MCALLEGELTRTSEVEADICEMGWLKVIRGAGDCGELQKVFIFSFVNFQFRKKKLLVQRTLLHRYSDFYPFPYPLEPHFARRGRIKHKADRIY